MFSVKRMLGNLNDFFIFIFHFRFHRLITSEHSTHTPRCSTLTPRFFVSGFGFVSEFCVYCRVLGFHRLISSEHSTHTHTTILDAHLTILLVPYFGFVFEFWVCCRVLGFHRLITFQHSTHTPRCSTPTP